MVVRWRYENWDPDNLGPTYQLSLHETKVDFFWAGIYPVWIRQGQNNKNFRERGIPNKGAHLATLTSQYTIAHFFKLEKSLLIQKNVHICT